MRTLNSNIHFSYSPIFFTLGTARPLIDGSLYLCRYGIKNGCIETLSNLSKFEKKIKVNTSGQPFLLDNKEILVPAWNAGFYLKGITGFSIFKSDDEGTSWKIVYRDEFGTYANHFFSDDCGARLFIGVGVDGGGRGSISYTPLSSYLLCSEDSGDSWRILYKLKWPTAIYDGIAIDNIVFFTAREKKSVFISTNYGLSFKEVYLGSTARNAVYWKKHDCFIVSSDDSFFIINLADGDSIRIKKLILSTYGIAFRYPIIVKDNYLYMTGVGSSSMLMRVSLYDFKCNCYDLMAEFREPMGSRMAIVADKAYVGSEITGTLYEVPLSSCRGKVDLITKLKLYFKMKTISKFIFKTYRL